MTTTTTKVIFNVDKKVKERAMLRAKSNGFTVSDYLSFAMRDLAEGKKSVGLVERKFEEEIPTVEDLKAIKRARLEFKNGDYITSQELFKKHGFKPKFTVMKK